MGHPVHVGSVLKTSRLAVLKYVTGFKNWPIFVCNKCLSQIFVASYTTSFWNFWKMERYYQRLNAVAKSKKKIVLHKTWIA